MRPQIGVSGFRIDLGIVHPDRPGDYLAGVECDGAMYHSALTARDRDQVRQAVLEGLGWKIIRIWSTDFWINAEQAIQTVHEKLELLLRSAREQPPAELERPCEIPVAGDRTSHEASCLVEGMGETIDNDESRNNLIGTMTEVAPCPPSSETASVSKIDDQNTSCMGRQPYQHANFSHLAGRIDSDRFGEPEYDQVIADMIRHAVEIEAPIEQSVLANVIARAHGFKRTGSVIAERVERIGRQLFHYRQESSGRTFVWRDKAHCNVMSSWRVPSDDDRKRSIEDIPEEEISLAASDCPPGDDLPRAIALAFGFSRLRAPSRQRIEGVLESQDHRATKS